MSILLPDAGLLFWMLIAFGIVFFILAKYAFPAITSMIDESLKNAEAANARLADIKTEGEAMLKAAREEQTKILREAAVAREQILREAREKAEAEGGKILAEARRVIEQEKEDALREIRNTVAELSISVAEKVLRRELSSETAEQDYTGRLVDEAMQQRDRDK